MYRGRCALLPLPTLIMLLPHSAPAPAIASAHIMRKPRPRLTLPPPNLHVVCSGSFSHTGYLATTCVTAVGGTCTVSSCDMGYHGTPSFEVTCGTTGTYESTPAGCSVDIGRL